MREGAMGIKHKIKKGSWGADVEGLGRVELRFERPRTAERFRMAPVVGRAAEQVYRYWALYDEIKAASDAAAEAGDEAAQIAALERMRELSEVLDADTFEAVAQLLVTYCEAATLDGEEADQEQEEHVELIHCLPATDLHLALQRLYKAEDGLTVAEGKPSASTSDT
jgi:hypothetical protein